MYQSFTGGLGGIALAKHGRSRAINAENPHGEKGKGGMAASELGPSRKGSPCLRDIEPGAVITLAEMEGPGEARTMLTALSWPQEVIDRVCYLVGHHHTYDNIDGMDYQILVEADFLVNLFEDGSTPDMQKNVFIRNFRTEGGKRLFRLMFESGENEK